MTSLAAKSLLTVAACGIVWCDREIELSPGGIEWQATPSGDRTIDSNHCVWQPTRQVSELRQQGDVLGIHMGAGYPEPVCEPSVFCTNCCREHWQGVARFWVGDGRQLAIASSHYAGSHIAVGRMATRDGDRRRWRGNRHSMSGTDWSVAPAPEDRIERDLLFSSDSAFNHPGGIQALGRYLFVPVQPMDGGSTGAVALYDVCQSDDPDTCDPLATPKLVWSRAVGTSADAVAALKRADGRFLMLVSNAKSHHLNLFLSSPGRRMDEQEVFGDTPNLMAPFAAIRDWQTGYQAIQLLESCEDHELFLLASHFIGQDLTPGEDWIDLWSLSLDEPNGSFQLQRVANRHLDCGTPGGKQCDLDAAAGAYVDPDGRLVLYATEHDNDGEPGGFVKMMEFSVESDELTSQ